MATPQPALKPAPDSCKEKARLAELIRSVMNDIIALNNRQLEAAMRHEFSLMKSVEGQLARARARKDSLLEQYQDHVNDHLC